MLLSNNPYIFSPTILSKIAERKFDLNLTTKFCDYVCKKYNDVICKSGDLSDKIRLFIPEEKLSVTVKARLLVFFEGLHSVLEEVNLIDHIVFRWNEFMKTHDNCELFGTILYYPDHINPTPGIVERDAQRLMKVCDDFSHVWGNTIEYVHTCMRYTNPGKDPEYVNTIVFLCDRPDYDEEKKVNLMTMVTFIWDTFIVPDSKELKPKDLLQLREYMEHIASDEEFDVCYKKHKTNIDSTVKLLTTPSVNDTIH